MKNLFDQEIFALRGENDARIAALEAKVAAAEASISMLQNPPVCRVYSNVDFIHTTSGTWQSITFNAERYDPSGMHSLAAATSRITFNTAGAYDIGGNVTWTNNAVGERIIAIWLNGATVIGSTSLFGTAGSTSGLHMSARTPGPYKMVVGDYVELRAYQNCGGPLTIFFVGNYSPEFGAVRVGNG